MKDVKIVFIDLDGTIKNSEGKISDKAFKSIEKLKKLGIYIVFTTGRSIPYTKYVAKTYNSSSYIITSNGAEIYNYSNDNVVFSSAISKENLEFIESLVKKYNLYFIANTKDNRCTNNYQNEGVLKADSLLEINSDINQVVIQSENINNMKLFRRDLEVNKELKIANKTNNLENKKKFFYDVTNSDVSKGNAVRKLCEYLNISTDKTMAIGDSYNDIDMLNACKYRVAVANADKELKEIANIETLSNDQDGVAVVLDRLYYEIIK